MKYKVIAYLETYPFGGIGSPKNKIRYKLRKRGLFGIWWTINDSDNEEELEKQAVELNLLKNR